jgi:hypothetical protein
MNSSFAYLFKDLDEGQMKKVMAIGRERRGKSRERRR